MLALYIKIMLVIVDKMDSAVHILDAIINVMSASLNISGLLLVGGGGGREICDNDYLYKYYTTCYQ